MTGNETDAEQLAVVLGMLDRYHGQVRSLFGQVHRTATVLPQCCHSAATVLPQYYHSTTTVLPQY